MLFYRYNLDNAVSRQFKILTRTSALCSNWCRELQDIASRVILI